MRDGGGEAPGRGARGPWAAFPPAIPNIRVPSHGNQELVGMPVYRVDVVNEGTRWNEVLPVRRVQIGEPYGSEVARRAARELLDTGHYATATVRAEAEPQGVRLIVTVTGRRVAGRVRVTGSPIDANTLLEAVDLREGIEVSESALPAIVKRVQQVLASRGYPSAGAWLETLAGESPLETELTVVVQAGAPAVIADRVFFVSPQPVPSSLRAKLEGYSVQVGEPADEEQLERADRELERDLRHLGHHRAVVSHRVLSQHSRTRLEVVAQMGALVTLAFEGQRAFDRDALLAGLDLENNEDLSPGGLAERLRAFYVKRGYLDAKV